MMLRFGIYFLFVSHFSFVEIFGEENSVCSPFSYDKAMLEKMIRTEIKFEQLRDEFNTLRRDVQSTWAAENGPGAPSSGERWQSKNGDKRTRINEFVSEHAVVLQEQGDKIEQLSNDLQALRLVLDSNNSGSQNFGTAVGFTATGVKDSDPGKGDTLIFPTVLTNPGGGYDAATGVFDAPFDGLYLLTVQVCTQKDVFFSVQLMVGSDEVGRVYTWDKDTFDCNSGATVAHIPSKGKAYVKVLQSGNIVHDNYRLVSFSGVLIARM